MVQNVVLHLVENTSCSGCSDCANLSLFDDNINNSLAACSGAHTPQVKNPCVTVNRSWMTQWKPYVPLLRLKAVKQMNTKKIIIILWNTSIKTVREVKLRHCKKDIVFPHGSIGTESACNAGDPGLIPGLGRSPGEGNGNPLNTEGIKQKFHYRVFLRRKWQALDVLACILCLLQSEDVDGNLPCCSWGSEVLGNCCVSQSLL